MIQVYRFLYDTKFTEISEYNITLVRVKLKEFTQISFKICHYKMANIITAICQTKSTKSSADTKETNWLLETVVQFYRQLHLSLRSHSVECGLDNYCFLKFRPRSYSSEL